MSRNKATNVTTDEQPSFYKNVAHYGTEFIESTSIHGIRYFGGKRTVGEKCWWLFVIAGSLYLCAGFIWTSYEKFNKSPVIISFAKKPTPIWKIPFPAVTLCPVTKSKQSVFNYKYFYDLPTENRTKDEQKRFEQVSIVCDYMTSETFDSEYLDADVFDFLSEVAPDLNQVLKDCSWRDLWTESCHQFTPIITEEGICFTFNMLDRDDIYQSEVYHYKDYLKTTQKRISWTLDFGYDLHDHRDTFPRRIVTSGGDNGLTFLLRGVVKDLDAYCNGPFDGMKMHLHHPSEIPKIGSQYIFLPINQHVRVGVKPKMITTEVSINSDPMRRNCYFSSEKYLRYFKNYTQEKCELECLTNYTLLNCQCVAYYMPRENSTKICGSGNTQCMTEAEDLLLSYELYRSRNEITIGDLDCGCLPSCTSLTYEADISQTDFSMNTIFRNFELNASEFEGMWASFVSIHFKESTFISYERSELYDWTEYVANCGGLLGVFIGFSFISVVEIFYFLTLRIFCNVRTHGRHYWSGNKNLNKADRDSNN